MILKKLRVPAKLQRYDIDSVYWQRSYEDTLEMAKEHINIPGVSENVDALKQEKEQYFSEVDAIVNSERETEQKKHKTYITWRTLHIILKWTPLASFVLSMLAAALEDKTYHPIDYIFTFIGLVLLLIFFLSIPGFLVAKIGHKITAKRYEKYIDNLSEQFDSLGRNFKNRAKYYYGVIDDLYLSSLNETQRMLVLLRREREEDRRQHQEEMAEMRLQNQRLMNQNESLLNEQRRNREAIEELLSIENRREDRYNSR